MPRIPKFQATKLPPGESGAVAVNPQLAARSGQALAGFGQQVQQSGKIADFIYQKEQIAHDAIEATRLESELKNRQLEISESLKGRTDYENFEADIDKQITDLRTLLPANASRRLSLAFENAYQQTAFSLLSNAKTKKWAVMDEQGQLAFGNVMQRAMEDWTNADANGRKIIENELEMKGLTLQVTNAVNPLWIQKQLNSFSKNVKKYAIGQQTKEAYFAAKEAPKETAALLRTDTYLPDLTGNARLRAIKEADRNAEAIDSDMVATSEVVALKREMERQHPNEPEIALVKALEKAESPDYQERIGSYKTHQRIISSLSSAYEQNEKAYNVFSEKIVGDLISRLSQNEISASDLPKMEGWSALRTHDRSLVTNFADKKSRAWVQDARDKKSLLLAERQAKSARQQDEATIFFGEVMAKMVDGSYRSYDQIVKDFTKDNPVIQGKLNSYLSTFKTIENAVELKYGVSAIKKAGSKGLLNPSNYQDNLFKQGKLISELRNKYMEDSTFRGEKINSWLEQKLTPEVRGGIGEFLERIFYGEAKTVKTVDINGQSYKDGDIIINEDGTQGIVRVH